MFDGDSDAFTRERDRVLNDETRRALRRAARLFGVAVVGVFTAIAVLSLAAATVILSVPWQLHVIVTVAVALALPVVVPYAMLRAYGLANRDVVYVAKRAYRETVAEIIALSGPSAVSADFDGTDTTESAESTNESSIINEPSQPTESTATETEP